MRKLRLLRLLRRGDQRAAMAVGGDDEASGDVVAEKRDARGVAAVAYGQGAAGVGNVFA